MNLENRLVQGTQAVEALQGVMHPMAQALNRLETKVLAQEAELERQRMAHSQEAHALSSKIDTLAEALKTIRQLGLMGRIRWMLTGRFS